MGQELETQKMGINLLFTREDKEHVFKTVNRMLDNESNGDTNLDLAERSLTNNVNDEVRAALLAIVVEFPQRCTLLHM